MKKILLSWQAVGNDHNYRMHGGKKQNEETINDKGPTFRIHQELWEAEGYSEHVLLHSDQNKEEEENFKRLVTELKRCFPNHKVIPRDVKLNDVTDFVEITPKIEELLSEFSDCEMEVFISPGTPGMLVAWILAASKYKNRIKLFKRKPPHLSANDEINKQEIDLFTDLFPSNISVAQKEADRNVVNQPFNITKSIEPIYEKAKKIASKDKVSSLILGENGTGKENLAKFIHDNSDRSGMAFIAVNCAAFSDELLRSELFGHVKGAFTGSISDKKGLFEAAAKGTLFLDEIGDISPRMQVSLLRVLQEQKIQPVGSTESRDINVRILAATNRDLEDLCEKGKFRWDLFFRLSVTILKLPALRERGKEELGEYINFFNSKFSKSFPGNRSKLILSKAAMEKINTYDFKGNIRELENMFIHLFTLCEDKVDVEDLPERLRRGSKNPILLEEVEKNHILKHYEIMKGEPNIAHLAKVLGITRQTLTKKLKKYKVL